eukprot:Skav228723  [mRNA]  locus=scaffold1830:248023:253567:- [translate_table: standard]
MQAMLQHCAAKARDIELLGDEQCLNDSVLDFFLKLAVDLVAPEHLKGDLYVASTFFYQKLTAGGVERLPREENGEAGWQNVRRWTRRGGGIGGGGYRSEHSKAFQCASSIRFATKQDVTRKAGGGVTQAGVTLPSGRQVGLEVLKTRTVAEVAVLAGLEEWSRRYFSDGKKVLRMADRVGTLSAGRVLALDER